MSRFDSKNIPQENIFQPFKHDLAWRKQHVEYHKSNFNYSGSLSYQIRIAKYAKICIFHY